MKSRAITLLLIVVCLAGCQAKSGQAILDAQKPGAATGAGATLAGPANSATPSTQTAKRRVGYYPSPAREWPLPTTGLQAEPAHTTPTAEPPVAPQPAWIDEQVTTTLGQHQDAAAIVQVANSAGSWGRARWFGILCVLFGVGGLLWAHNNPEGYPLICWKIAGIGLALVIFDPNPWWLLLLIVPGLFYCAQKLNLIRPL